MTMVIQTSLKIAERPEELPLSLFTQATPPRLFTVSRSGKKYPVKLKHGAPLGYCLVMWAMHNAPRYTQTWEEFLVQRGYDDIVKHSPSLRGKGAQVRLQRLHACAADLAFAATLHGKDAKHAANKALNTLNAPYEPVRAPCIANFYSERANALSANCLASWGTGL